MLPYTASVVVLENRGGHVQQCCSAARVTDGHTCSLALALVHATLLPAHQYFSVELSRDLS